MCIALAAQGDPLRPLETLRTGIQRLNRRHGTPETPTRGYNETRTCAWLLLVLQAVREAGESADWQAVLRNTPALRDAGLLERYYSVDVLASAETKHRFVLPDRLRLPGDSALIADMRAQTSGGHQNA